jgi:hypothetical protein
MSAPEAHPAAAAAAAQEAGVGTFVEGFHDRATFLPAHLFRELGRTGLRVPPP